MRSPVGGEGIVLRERLTQETSVLSQQFVGHFCTRYDPLLTPLPLGEGLGEGAAGAKTPSPSPSPPQWGEGKKTVAPLPHSGERGNSCANFRLPSHREEGILLRESLTQDTSLEPRWVRHLCSPATHAIKA